MYNFKELVKRDDVKSFEKISFIASTWRIIKRPVTMRSSISAVKQISLLLLKKIFTLNKRNMNIEKSKLYFYAQSNHLTSFGTLAPILDLQKDNAIIIINNLTESNSKNFNSIHIDKILKNFSLLQFFILLKNSIVLANKVKNILNENIDLALIVEYLKGFMIHEFFKNIFTNEDILVVDSDFEPVGRGIVQAININGGKSICLQHGTFSDRLFPTYVKNYFVWGNHFKIDIRKYINDDIEVQALGYPRIDIEYFETSKNKSLNSIYKNCFLVISNLHSASYTKYLAEFFDILKTVILEGQKVIIKLHKFENKEIYIKNLDYKLLSKINFVRDEIPIKDLIYNSNYVFLIESAAAVEIVLMEKLLLVFDSELNSMPKYQCGLYVNSSNIRKLLINISDKSNYRDLIEKQTAYLPQLISNYKKSAPIIMKHIKKVK